MQRFLPPQPPTTGRPASWGQLGQVLTWGSLHTERVFARGIIEIVIFPHYIFELRMFCMINKDKYQLLSKCTLSRQLDLVHSRGNQIQD